MRNRKSKHDELSKKLQRKAARESRLADPGDDSFTIERKENLAMIRMSLAELTEFFYNKKSKDHPFSDDEMAEFDSAFKGMLDYIKGRK
jgi:hypothetical protein